MDLRSYSMRSTLGWLFALLLVLGACSSVASSKGLAASVDRADGLASTPPPEATEILEEEIAALSGRLPREAPLPIGWSRIPHDEAVFGDEGGEEMWSVVSGGPGLVAVGISRGDDTDAAVWTSVDGITWSRVPHDMDVFGEAEMRSVTVGGPGLVAVGKKAPATPTKAAQVTGMQRCGPLFMGSSGPGSPTTWTFLVGA